MWNKFANYKIKPTKFGIWVIFLACFLLFSAQNTGNNLLYLVCSSVFTAIIFALTDTLISLIGFKAELIYPQITLIGERVNIICKIAKVKSFARYFIRFEDSWLEKIEKGYDGYLRKDLIFNKRGRYEIKNLSIIKPSMLDIFYFQYTFPDFIIYAVEDIQNGSNKKFIKESETEKNVKCFGRDGEFYAHELYQEGDDASHINWTVSARSNEEWVAIRERDYEELKKLQEYNERVKSLKLPFEKYEITGKSYGDLSKASLKKELNPSVFRLMLLLALLVCFGVYNIGFLHNLIPWISFIFIIFAIKGKAINPKFHKYFYFSSLIVASYILYKNFAPNAPLKIVLLLEFSILILSLQYITMINIRNILSSLTLIFMILLGIAAMNVNSAFPAIFLPFLILTSMILTFFRVNLVSTDAVAKNKFSTSPKGIKGTLLLLSIFAFLWIPFFYLIPRTNSYGLASELAEEKSTKGFSNTSMSLNDSGFLEDNLTVIMRVIPNNYQDLSPSIIRRMKSKKIRGGSFSEYENGEWKKFRRGLYIRSLQNTSGELNLDRNFKDFKSLHNFEIVLEGTNIPTVFVPDQTKRINFHENSIGMEMDNSLFFIDRTTVYNKRYNVSLLLDNDYQYEDSSVSELIQSDYYLLLKYLSLNGISDRIIEQANTFAKESNSIDARVKLVINYLQSNYDYSLEQPSIPVGKDPVDYFLFESKTGTCQHFATAMVFLLRGMGIPSRVVNGYQMGDWNETGEFFTVRQSDAHAWVEVFYPKSGWIPFDPTPIDPNEETSKIKQLWNKIVEVYEGYWFNYVYSFDQRAQALANKNLFNKTFKQVNKIIMHPFVMISFTLAIVLYCIFSRYIESIWRYYKKSSHWIPFSYLLWENKLHKKRHNSETPSEFHKRLLKENAINSSDKEILTQVEQLIDEYAFKKDANKSKINKEIKTLLRSITSIL